METINKFLARQGRVSYNNLLMYRMVWSTKETEIREGEFEEHTESGVYLRTIRGVREVPKYSYIPDRWILEKWCPPSYTYCREIKGSEHGGYEPFYVFESKSGNYLEPTLKVVEFVIGHERRCQEAHKDSITRRNEMIEDAEKKRQARLQQDIDRIADATRSEIGLALHLGEGVGYTKETICPS